MLAKRRRIPRHLFPGDPRTGTVFHSAHVSLRVTGRKIPAARISVVVGKKSAPKATDRHSVKRRIYDALSRAERRTPLPPALYVFFAKQDAHAISYALLSDEIETLLAHARGAIVKSSKLV